MSFHNIRLSKKVSTHSRPKAAGSQIVHIRRFSLRFNSQPPEGGWRFAAVFM